MTQELLPCPFCGGEAEADASGSLEFGGHNYQTDTVECKQCGAKIEKDDCTDCNPNLWQQTIDAWNRRTAIK